MRPIIKPKSNDHSLGARLKRYRIAKNLTIKSAAKQFDVPFPTWAGWEGRGREPQSYETAKKIFSTLETFEKTKAYKKLFNNNI